MKEHLFERLACERGITAEEMRGIISARIERGWNNPDPEKRAQWRKIPCVGEIPTPELGIRAQVQHLKAYASTEAHRNLLKSGTASGSRGQIPPRRKGRSSCWRMRRNVRMRIRGIVCLM